jgi:predicted Zn finger-like uncharacterized protein
MDQKFEEIETACPNCKMKFKISNMKLDPDSNRMICVNCFNFPGAKVEQIR